MDAERTRSEIFDSKKKKNLFLILRTYCEKTDLIYKQGLNEVLAPFVYLRKANVSYVQIYNIFTIFMKKYLRNLFEDEVLKK